MQSKVKREKLKMDKGEWVNVIGWLGGETPKGMSNVSGVVSHAWVRLGTLPNVGREGIS